MTEKNLRMAGSSFFEKGLEGATNVTRIQRGKNLLRRRAG